MPERKYPVGIQTFSEIIRGGYVYVDKTGLMWKMQRAAKYVFLSRPRRFGKSLLSSTLHSFFDGEKDLFQGLQVMNLEQEWTQYPVFHIDLSVAKSADSPTQLQSFLTRILQPFVDRYGRGEEETTPGGLLDGLIRRAFMQSGKQVVVIIDEYDAPLLDVLHDNRQLVGFLKVMQEFYAPLKAREEMVRFCFITGITKFSQLSIFSVINNLLNVSMDPQFAAICGITEQELMTFMEEDVGRIAEVYECTKEEMHERLRLRYDGYRFSRSQESVYNPFSLLKCFLQQELANYWFESGTPSFLIQQMKFFRTDILSLERMDVPASSFDQPTENMQDALPLLYQSGYLTIKDYDRESLLYTLSIPNQEVRVGITEGLMPAYVGLKGGEVQAGFAYFFWKALKDGDIDRAMREMQAYLAGIPYVEGFKKKLAEAATAEGFYEYTLYLIFSMLNVYVRTQVKCAGGRIDMVVSMPDTDYVFELKTAGSAEAAVAQINEHDYALPFGTDGRKVVKVGVKMNVKTRTVEEWVVG